MRDRSRLAPATEADPFCSICRSEETGIADWNYIDYVLVYGSLGDIQPAALRTGVNAVVYVPDADAYGDDFFSFYSTDCAAARGKCPVVAAVQLATAASSEEEDTCFLAAPHTLEQLWHHARSLLPEP